MDDNTAIATLGEEERQLLVGLRDRNPEAVAALVDRSYPALLLLAGQAGGRGPRLVEEAWRDVMEHNVADEPLEDLRLRIRAVVLQRARTAEGAGAEPSPVAAVPPACFETSESHWPGWWKEAAAERAASGALHDEWPDEGSEIWDHLAEAIRRLPLGERVVVVLRHIEGWSPEEVEELVGLSPSRLRSRLHAARSRLHHALDQAGADASAADTLVGTSPPSRTPRSPDYDFSCEEMVEMTTEFLEGGQTPRERAFFEQHLLVCEPCLAHLHRLRATTALLRGLPQAIGPAPEDLRQSVLARLAAVG